MPIIRSLFALMLLRSMAVLGQQDITVDRTMRIGLHRERTVKQAIVMPVKGNWWVVVDGERKGEVSNADGLRIAAVPGGLSARSLTLDLKARRSIELVPRNGQGGFRLRLPETKQAERTYPGTARVVSAGGSLLLVSQFTLFAQTKSVSKSFGNG